jgi:hypothetical protein
MCEWPDRSDTIPKRWAYLAIYAADVRSASGWRVIHPE